jgi:glycosyltransferase involved in cell wall biosynthesis
MNPGRRRVLYIDAYTMDGATGRQAPSSMSIGYGITSSNAICRSFQECGYRVTRPMADTKPYGGASRIARLKWVLQGYQSIADGVAQNPPDLIFIFHSFSAFPVEIRRILLEQGLDIPLVGYTHGSHWDSTDGVRRDRYPGLQYLDLANLAALDLVLFDSNFIKQSVIAAIRQHNYATAELIDGRSAAVGMPIDLELIDRCKTEERFPGTTLIFNHAPVAAKNPAEFAEVAARLMPKLDINVLFTRSFDGDVPGGEEVRALREKFGDRVILGGDMPLEKYYRALWMSDVQVSTAAHESFGVATLEAMYTENFCLLPDRGSYPEICGGRPDVLYDSVPDLEERITYLVSDPRRRRSVGEALADRAREYGPATVVPRILDAIEGMFHDTAGRAAAARTYDPRGGTS